MRKFVPYLLLAVAFCQSAYIYAQQGKESRVPLRSNPRLQEEARLHPAIPVQPVAFQKTASLGQRFPFIDWFDQAGTELYDSLWDLKLVKRTGEWAVLNAQDEIGATYSGGGFGE